VQDAGVVPDDQVAAPPVVSQGEARLGGPAEQPVEQRAAFVVWQPDDVVRRCTDEQGLASVAPCPDQRMFLGGILLQDARTFSNASGYTSRCVAARLWTTRRSASPAFSSSGSPS
jgi:hypothetical protein